MNQPMTLGSLFDGIGGFCLAGKMAGVKPVWSSEIEPFPVRVTEKRFPDVLQLGDVHGVRISPLPANVPGWAANSLRCSLKPSELSRK